MADSVDKVGSGDPAATTGEILLLFQQMAKDMPDMTAQIMARHFSVHEIMALTNSYSTPAERSIVKKTSAYYRDNAQQTVPYIYETTPADTVEKVWHGAPTA